MALNQRNIDRQRIKQRYNDKIQAASGKLKNELEVKLQAQRKLLQVRCCSARQPQNKNPQRLFNFAESNERQGREAEIS